MPSKSGTLIPVDWHKIEVPSTAILCPNCRTKSHFTPMTYSWRTHVPYEKAEAWVIQKCDNCSELILTVFQPTGSIISGLEVGAVLELHSLPKEVFPYFRPIPDASIPREVAEDYSEAILCFSSGAFDASAAMGRRAIETAAIKLGAKRDDRLIDMIKFLSKNGLEKSLIELATEIRLLGNVPAAHPDKYDSLRRVTRDECKSLVDFLEAFLNAIYIRPAEIERLRKKKA
jgi:hypothetical protein